MAFLKTKMFYKIFHNITVLLYLLIQ